MSQSSLSGPGLSDPAYLHLDARNLENESQRYEALGRHETPHSEGTYLELVEEAPQNDPGYLKLKPRNERNDQVYEGLEGQRHGHETTTGNRNISDEQSRRTGNRDPGHNIQQGAIPTDELYEDIRGSGAYDYIDVNENSLRYNTHQGAAPTDEQYEDNEFGAYEYIDVKAGKKKKVNISCCKRSKRTRIFIIISVVIFSVILVGVVVGVILTLGADGSRSGDVTEAPGDRPGFDFTTFLRTPQKSDPVSLATSKEMSTSSPTTTSNPSATRKRLFTEGPLTGAGVSDRGG